MDETRRPPVRKGIVRAFVAAVAVALLVLPVGVGPEGSVVRVTLSEALGHLAQGRIGFGILSGIVVGGGLRQEALYRIILSSLAWLAFVLAGLVRHQTPTEPPPRRRCPHCEAWVSREMYDCPSCGRRLRSR
ncbi:MAG TPA: hypothetical protein VM840_05595 [Actinomycetota bacterium]|nr:hypothetical protein [Actinomycetota bacterium]